METLKSAIREPTAPLLNRLIDNLWSYVSPKISTYAKMIFEPTLNDVLASKDVELKCFVFAHMLCHSERELDVKAMVTAATTHEFTEDEIRLLKCFFRQTYELCTLATQNEPVDVVAFNIEVRNAFNFCVA